MGDRTLLTYKDDLKAALGRPSEDPARMTRWVNDAVREFAYAFKFHELEKSGAIVTAQGVTDYAMPADFRIFNGEVYVTGPQNRFWGILTPEARVNYLRSGRYPVVTNYARPAAYHLYGNRIFLRPTPDATVMNIAFDYWGKITQLVADGDKTQFADDWDEVVFRGALYRGHMHHGEHDRMINTFNMFLGLLRSRVTAEDLEEFPEGGISYIQGQFDSNVRS